MNLLTRENDKECMKVLEFKGMDERCKKKEKKGLGIGYLTDTSLIFWVLSNMVGGFP